MSFVKLIINTPTFFQSFKLTFQNYKTMCHAARSTIWTANLQDLAQCPESQQQVESAWSVPAFSVASLWLEMQLAASGRDSFALRTVIRVIPAASWAVLKQYSGFTVHS